MDFGDARHKQEFFSEELDARVRSIALELDLWITAKQKKAMFVTGVLRTAAEQAAIYPDNPTKPSPHTDRPCRAIDFRRTHFTPEETLALVGYFNFWWGRFKTALLLVDDRGPQHPHLHLAVYDI